MTDHLNNEQLQADLRVYRGGNKARLVARCWVAVVNAPGGSDEHLGTYEAFRATWTKQPFWKLHQVFDHLLPQQFRA